MYCLVALSAFFSKNDSWCHKSVSVLNQSNGSEGVTQQIFGKQAQKETMGQCNALLFLTNSSHWFSTFAAADNHSFDIHSKQQMSHAKWTLMVLPDRKDAPLQELDLCGFAVNKGVLVFIMCWLQLHLHFIWLSQLMTQLLDCLPACAA